MSTQPPRGPSGAPASPYDAAYRPAQPIGRARKANPAVRAFVTVFGLLVLVASVGLLAMNAAIAAPRWNVTELGASTSVDGVSEVVVSSRRADVTVTSTSSPELTWTAQFPGDPTQIEQNAVTTSGGRLTISPEAPRALGFMHGFSWGWFEWDQGRIGVEVPSAPLLDLRLETGIGDANAMGEWAGLSVSSGIGDVTLGGACESVDISAGLGDVRGTLAVDGGPLTIRGGIGDISLTLQTAAPSEVEVNGGIGSITLNLPPTTHGYVVGGTSGIGGTTNTLPEPDPDGIPVDSPVRITINAGVGDVTLGSSLP